MHGLGYNDSSITCPALRGSEIAVNFGACLVVVELCFFLWGDNLAHALNDNLVRHKKFQAVHASQPIGVLIGCCLTTVGAWSDFHDIPLFSLAKRILLCLSAWSPHEKVTEEPSDPARIPSK